MGSRASKGFKYSKVAETVEGMVRDAAEHFALADSVLGNEQRFAPPLPSSPADRPIADVAVSSKAPLELANWASSHSLVLHRLLARSKVALAINRSVSKPANQFETTALTQLIWQSVSVPLALYLSSMRYEGEF